MIDSHHMFHQTGTYAAKKDRSHSELAFKWTIKRSVDHDSGPHAIWIDVAGKAKHRADPRAGWTQCRVDESRWSTTAQKSFHVSHRVSHLESARRGQSLRDEFLVDVVI